MYKNMSVKKGDKIVTSIKCYGKRSTLWQYYGIDCYTYKELYQLAKKRGKPLGGTKEELANRLDLRYFDFGKYASAYAVFGYYEYNTIHMGKYTRFSNGREETTKSIYVDRIAGLAVEKIVSSGSRSGKDGRSVFDWNKASKAVAIAWDDVKDYTLEKQILRIEKRYEGKVDRWGNKINSSYIIDQLKQDILVIRQDIIAIFDKLDAEYTPGGLEYIENILMKIKDASSTKEKSVLLPVTRNS